MTINFKNIELNSSIKILNYITVIICHGKWTISKEIKQLLRFIRSKHFTSRVELYNNRISKNNQRQFSSKNRS